MKKFILRLLSILTSTFLIILILNFYYVKTEGYQTLNDLEKFSHIENNLEIVNLGSSHGMCSFDYSATDYNGFNFGLNFQNLYYDYQLLLKFQKNLKNNCIVILPISLFTFGQSNYNESQRYYKILDPIQIYNFTIKDFIIYKVLPILSAKSQMIYMFKDIEVGLRYDSFKDISKETSKRDIQYLQNYNRYSENLIYFDTIISFCKAKNYKIILITTPLTGLYLEKIPKTLKVEYNNFLFELANRYEISYLDYSSDNRFMNNQELFMNTDHLNKKGAELFTKIVIEDLKKLGIIKEK